MSDEYRIEHDSMGEVPVPREALWRAQTQRAVENFPISGSRLEPDHLRALALIKASAAKVNHELDVLDDQNGRGDPRSSPRGVRPESTCDAFPVDVFQTGSGTSSNMNMNEVLASLARGAGVDGTPQRPRQRQPVQQRRLPDLDPRRRRAGGGRPT